MRMKARTVLTLVALLLLPALPIAGGTPSAAQPGKIKFFRNPMNPEDTSPVAKKDEMGMDYIPVYEQAGVYVSPERQQMIGVTTEPVKRRQLKTVIDSVGKVAYDPGLFVAQEEYLQALSTRDRLGSGAMAEVGERARSLIEAARKKLLLLGMSEQGIDGLEKQGAPQENLYLPGKDETAWVYINVYEYEIGMVKEHLGVEITTNAYPGETFSGIVSALSPVINKETRSMQVRTVVQDPGHKLKPEMFVNASIGIDLGEKLAVPESAVLDTGARKIVYVVKDDSFEQREIRIGARTDNYYEILSGVTEGEMVVTSGNFLVDSESRMKSSSGE